MGSELAWKVRHGAGLGMAWKGPGRVTVVLNDMMDGEGYQHAVVTAFPSMR